MKSFFPIKTAIFRIAAIVVIRIFLARIEANSVGLSIEDEAASSRDETPPATSFFRTIVSAHSPFIYQTKQFFEFLNEHRKYPSTLLIPDGYLTFLCTKTDCERPYILYPSSGDGDRRERLVGDRAGRKSDRRTRYDIKNIAKQKLTITTVKVDKDFELGEYECVCGKTERTPLFSMQILYRPCLTPTSKCQYADVCTRSLSQLMGCLVVKGGADSRETKSKKSMKCEKLTSKICAQVHGPYLRYKQNNYSICSTNGRKLDNLCEAVSSGNADAAPIYYIRTSKIKTCSTKNKDGVFPRALYWQQTQTQAECSFKHKDHWKLASLQSFVYMERNRPVTLCYVCDSEKSKVNYTVEFYKETVHGSGQCRKMTDSSSTYVVFLNISTPATPRAQIKIAENYSYVDVLYASGTKPLKSIVSRLSFSPRNIYVTCEHDMNRHESNPANGFIEYEWRDPLGFAIYYPDTKDHGHTHELIGLGNHTCYVKLKSCYFHTRHMLTYASSVYEAQFMADSSTIYLVIAITIIALLITTILGVVVWHICKQRMAKRRFMFLTGNAEEQARGQDNVDGSLYGTGGTPTRSSNQPSLVSPQAPRSKYLIMIKNLSAKKSMKNVGAGSLKMKSHKSTLHSSP